MTNSHYLEQGPQTQFTDRVHEYAGKARNIVMKDSKVAALPEPLLSVHKTCKYIANELGKCKKPKDEIFRKRDLNQILGEGIYPTCSDIGLVFRGLMAAQGIPTAYVEAFHEDYLFELSFHTHTFGRVFEGGKTYIVNPTQNPTIVEDEVDIFPYVIFREGLDSWDIGIYSEEDLHRLRQKNMEALLARYEQNLRASFQRKAEALQALRDRIRI